MPYADSNYERSWKMQTKGVMLYPATTQRLLAAAPELLAACQEAVSAITYLLSNGDDDPNYADTLNTLAAAIAKAEGRSE